MRFRLKKGYGTHKTRDGKKITAGEIIRLSSKYELGGALDKFDQLDPDPPPPPPRVGLIAQPGKYGRWNVFNPDGVKVNDVPLLKREADDRVRGTRTEPGHSSSWFITENPEVPSSFDVVSRETGESANEQPLSMEEAETLLEEKSDASASSGRVLAGT